MKNKDFKYFSYNEKNRSNKISINSSNLELNNFDRNKFKINLNRIAFVFIIIVTIIVLYLLELSIYLQKTLEKKYFSNQISRADIIDRNGNYVSKSVLTTNIGIDPKLVKDKKTVN